MAQTYEPGSPEFNEVFDIAVRLFPDDETANLNAACTDLQKGDLTSAEKHLAKAGNSKEAERVRDVFKQIKELTSAEKHLAKAGNSKEAERVRDVFKQIKELE